MAKTTSPQGLMPDTSGFTMMLYRRQGNGAIFTVFTKTAKSPMSN
jgi:hypothetical protein